jgi:hypothetical protein
MARSEPSNLESGRREQPADLLSVVWPVVRIARANCLPREPTPEEHERVREGVPNGQQKEATAAEDPAELLEGLPISWDVLEGAQAHDAVEGARTEWHPACVSSNPGLVAGAEVEPNRIEPKVPEGHRAPTGATPNIEDPSFAGQAELPPWVYKEHLSGIFLVVHPSRLQTVYATLAAFRVKGR